LDGRSSVPEGLARRVFDWSLYSQRTRDIGDVVVSADTFIQETLKFFGDDDPTKSGSPPSTPIPATVADALHQPGDPAVARASTEKHYFGRRAEELADAEQFLR